MYDWKITIEAWPYFDPPAVEAQAKIAPRVREFIIKADSFRDAQRAAELICMGVHSHDKVHKANIWTVARWPLIAASVA
jgi:hypothetical protein